MSAVCFELSSINSAVCRRFFFWTSFRSFFLVLIASFCVLIVGTKSFTAANDDVPSDAIETKKGETTLNRRLIPDGIKHINKKEFNIFLSSEYVSIPASVEEIKENAFDELDAFTRIMVDENNPCFQSIDGALLTKDDKTLLRAVVQPDGSIVVPNGTKKISRNSFNFRTTLKRVVIPSSVEEIDRYVFGRRDESLWVEVAEDNPFYQSAVGSLLTKNDKTLVYGYVDFDGSANVPDGTKRIDGSAFWFNSLLNSLWIPASVEEIDLNVFQVIDRTTPIDVSKDNPFFLSVDDSLLTKEDKTLVYCYVDFNGFAVVPDGTKRIDRDAFGKCSSLKHVWIPSSVEEIDDGAFRLFDASAIFEVAEENRFFQSVNGALVTKDGKTLIRGVVGYDGAAVIPNGVKKLEIGSFNLKSLIRSLWIPSSVETIDFEVFEDLDKSTRVEVAEDNPFFQTVGGAFLKKDDKALIRVGVNSDGSLVIPEGTKKLRGRLIICGSTPKRVLVPSSVEEIGTDTLDRFDTRVRYEVSQDNPFFQSLDGSLATKDGKTLIRGFVSLDGFTVVPDGIKKLDADVFGRSVFSYYILIPSSVEEIGTNVFARCVWETRFEVAEKNSSFQSVDGSLLTKDNQTLLHCYITPDHSAIVPDGTKKISAGAFKYKSGLKRILIPSSVEEFEEGAFDKLNRSVQIEVAEDNLFFQSVDGSLTTKAGQTLIYCRPCSDGSAIAPEGTRKIAASVFRNDWRLKRFLIPPSVEEIEKGAFEQTRASIRFEVAEENRFFQSVDGSLLTKDDGTLIRCFVQPGDHVVVPEGTKKICASDFCHDTRLKRISIPSSVEEFEEGALEQKNESMRIEVAEENRFFKSVDGSLLTKDGKTLIRCYVSPKGLAVVPEGTKKIGAKVFQYSLQLERISIPSSVEEFEEGALDNFFVSAQIEVAEENRFFKSVDGSLLTRDGATLIRCFVSLDGSAVVPNGTKKLDENVFHSRAPLKRVSIPPSVEAIDDGTFGEKRPTICGEAGSAAERYANANGLPFKLLEKTN